MTVNKKELYKVLLRGMTEASSELTQRPTIPHTDYWIKEDGGLYRGRVISRPKLVMTGDSGFTTVIDENGYIQGPFVGFVRASRIG